MKKLSLVLSSLCIASLLFSSGSSPFDEAVSFLNKHEAALYYCGNESNVYSHLENYHDLSPSEFPESYPNISSFILDVENKRDIITTDFLDEIYSTFYTNTYAYVMFTNFNENLFLLAGSDFAYHYPSYYRDNSEMLLYYNSGKSDSIHVNGYTFGFNPDEKNSTEYIQKIIVQTYYQFVKSDLMEQ